MKKVLAFIMIVVIMLTPPMAFAESQTSVENNVGDDKVYCDATLDDDFADDCVIVVINKSYSEMVNTLSVTQFENIDVKNITRLTEDASVEENSLDLTNTENIRHIIKIDLKTAGKANVLEAIKELEKLEFVESAEPDYYFYPDEINETEATDSVTANDPYFEQQYALSKICASEAWNFTTGSLSVRVGIIDSGISNHPDLAGNLVAGWDFVNNNSVTTDDPSGHGTHVAGIIGATGNNSIGVSGVSWNVSLVPLQVAIDNGSGFSSSAIIKAIEYAKQNDIPIINCSFGGYRDNYAYETQIKNYGGLVIASAGNGAVDTDLESHDPSGCPLDNIISVASTDSNDVLASTSNYGKVSVDLSAPGVSIWSTYLGSTYKYLSGTSMAAPYVTGVAALIKSIRPDLSAVQIKQCILQGTDYASGLHNACVTMGRLNANKALAIAKDYTEGDYVISTLSGDFDANGKDDIAMICYREKTGQTCIKVALSNGTEFSTEQVWWDSGTRMFDASIIKDRVVADDFDGDGKADIAAMMDLGNQNMQLIVWMSAGTSFSNYEVWNDQSPSGWYNTSLVADRVVAGDFNGDGKADIAAMHDYMDQNMKIFVWKSNGSSFAMETWFESLESKSYNANLINGRMVAGDFDGDGKDEIAAMHDYLEQNMKIFVWKSNGTSFVKQTGFEAMNVKEYNANLVTGRMTAGDFNGDGKDDIAAMHDYLEQNMKIFVWKTDGSGFEKETWADYSTPKWYNTELVTGRFVAGNFTSGNNCDVAGLHDYSNHLRLFVWKSDGSQFATHETWNSDIRAY